MSFSCKVGERLSAAGIVVAMVGAVLSMVPAGTVYAALARPATAAATGGGAFVALTPTRLTDTRSGAPVGPRGTVTVPLASSVPPSATAVALSVTAVDGTASGYLSAYPTGPAPASPTSVLNYVAGPPNCSAPDCVVPNLVISKIGGSAVTVANGSTGTVDVVVDLEGYFDPTGATTSGAGHYRPAGPARVADTRCATTPPAGGLSAAQCGAEGLLAANTTKGTVASGGALNVATGLAGASAAIVQLTATDTTADGYLTAYGAGSRPTASNVNFVAGQTTSTRAIVAVAGDGSINVFNYAGSVDVVVDVVGSFSDSTGSPTAGSLFTPVTPQRVTNTRTNSNGVDPNATTTVAVAGGSGIPPVANGSPTAAALNVTEAADTAPGYLTVTPEPISPPATTSDVNFSSVPETRANADIAALNPAGTVSVYNHTGQTQLVVDAFGYFTAAPAPLAVTTTSLPEGTVGQAYPPTTLAATGGTAPYTWSVAGGSALPPGLTLSDTGVISGTPTATGHSGVAVTVTDSTAASTTASFGITVRPAPMSPAQLSIIAGRNRALAPGPATTTPVYPGAVAVDTAGNLFIADETNQVVEKVTPDGILSIVAGIVGMSGPPTPGPATASELRGFDGPGEVAVDTAGNLYIADAGNSVVEKVTPAGILSIVAGSGTYGAPPTPGPATSSELGPGAVAVDAAGNLYIIDHYDGVLEFFGYEVVKVTPGGTLSSVPGTSQVGEGPQPVGGIAVDAAGNVYIASSSGNPNSDVVKVTPGGSRSIVAGAGPSGPPTPGPAVASDLYGPDAVALDAAGNLYIADTTYDGSGSAVEKVTPGGILSIVAGTVGKSGPPTPGPATSSELGTPAGVAVDGAGDLFIADTSNDVVERVTSGGTLSIVAGTGATSGPPIPGPAAKSSLGTAAGVAVDTAGNLYIADETNHAVEKVTPSGILSIVAGIVGNYGPPTPGPATFSELGGPGGSQSFGVAVDAAGDLYIADSANEVVEKVTPAGILSIVAGSAGKSGPPTPGPATSSELGYPQGVAVDAAGNLYIADNGVVEKVTSGGILSVFAGNGKPGPPTPGPATSSELGYLHGVAVDTAGNLYIADTGNSVVEKVTPAGILSIVAGTGQPGPPTPGPATSSELGTRAGVAVDAAGNLYIADAGNSVVEKVTPAGTLSIVAGTGKDGPPTPGPATTSNLSPDATAVDAAGNLYIAGNNDVEEVIFPAG
ncbi:MAG: hypothetical protein M3Y91_09340 [Actinomycetota bacterium]|nr:hypothetical protein [Actinomycetota bacterium]